MAVELETALADHVDEVFDWRFEELCRAGFPDELAAQLALAKDVDLHAAVELPRRGCPHATAARILL